MVRAFLALAVLLGALVDLSAGFKPADSSSSRFVPNSYFVEVDASSSALSKRGLTPFAVRCPRLPPSPSTRAPSAWLGAAHPDTLSLARRP